MHRILLVRIAARAAAAVAVAAAIVPALPAAALGSPPRQPTLLSPPPGWVFRYSSVQLFSLVASDDDADPYTAVVTIRRPNGSTVRVFTTHVAASGAKASGVPVPPLDPGQYTWSAHAVDATGLPGPESSLSGFSIEPAPSVGGGEVDASLLYGGSGVAHGSCLPTTFDFDGYAIAAAVNLGIVGFVGALDVTGNGGSTCENGVYGEGTISLTFAGTGPTGSSMHCPELEGTYVRAGAALAVLVGGMCTVNAHSLAVEVTLTAAYAPLQIGGGATAPYRSAAALGGFTVIPT